MENEQRETQVYLDRLDRMVRYLLSGRYGTSQRLWKLQLDLLALQQDLQRRIRELKAVARDEVAQRDLHELRDIREQARRFGDAIAWLFLGLDRKVITPLADNDPVAIPLDEHGTRGLLVFAEAMGSRGWGFPILHDITDCLRIGDVTFLRPDEPPLTVEIKTRMLGGRRHDDGGATYNYEVSALSARPLPDPEQRVSPAGERQPAQRNHRLLDHPRVVRQFDRMIKVRSRQDALPDELVDIKDEAPLVVTEFDNAGVTRWDVLRRVARRARRLGYAAESVDDAFLFVALYDAQGLTQERLAPLLERLPQDVVASGILRLEPGALNGVWVNSIPETPRRAARRYLPYFLYSLPRATILDLLHGRMALFHLANPAQIAAALESAGFAVRPAKGNDYRKGFDVRTEFTTPSGERWGMALGPLEMPMREMVMEFHSVEFIVRTALRMREIGIETFAARADRSAG